MGIFDKWRRKNVDRGSEQRTGQPSENNDAKQAVSGEDTEKKKAEISQAALDPEIIKKITNAVYPGIALFARDTNLRPGIPERYKQGMIIREKAFVDASNRFMGMVTTHRFVIMSNHMLNFGMFENGTNWGLCTANADSRFKVLGQIEYNGKTAIFLLHLPNDETWKVYQTMQFSIDEALYQMAVERFKAKCMEPPVPELTTPEWLSRCQFPVGMSDSGEFWPLEDV